MDSLQLREEFKRFCKEPGRAAPGAETSDWYWSLFLRGADIQLLDLRTKAEAVPADNGAEEAYVALMGILGAKMPKSP
jgi:hypothetical protein